MKKKYIAIIVGLVMYYMVKDTGYLAVTPEHIEPLVKGAATQLDELTAAVKGLVELKENGGGWEPLILGGLYIALDTYFEHKKTPLGTIDFEALAATVQELKDKIS